ncbi:MAG: multicopper oxidase domain-containing protein [Actinomycetota bacterium]
MASPRRSVLAALVALVAVLLGSIPSGAQVADVGAAQTQICDNPARTVSLFATRIGPRKVGYGLTPGNPTVPGPTIEMTEGECIAINLVNDSNIRVGIHAHGVEYTVFSDGTPVNASCVPPGRSRTYLFSSHLPVVRTDGTIDPGNAGYWHYHDHCAGTPHGTLGLKRGLFGALIVRRPGDPVPDRPPFVVVMGPGQKINLQKAPNIRMFKANQGQRIEFVVIGHGDEFHTFHLHGHRWANTRTGYITDLKDTARLIDNRTVGPADSFGFQVVAGERVGPGAWMFHCHVQFHSDGGMVSLLLVRTPDGRVTPQEKAAVRRFKKQEGHGGH